MIKRGLKMKDIESFTVDHETLTPGVYLSRVDSLGDRKLYTYDLRMVAPNRQQPLEMNGVHTIEHTGATFLRNHEKYGEDVIYFGPMGCRTGFYLILTDCLDNEAVLALIKEMFQYIVDYNGPIPGASPEACGNFDDHSQFWAKFHAKDYLKVLDAMEEADFRYLKD